jgi:cytochrome c
VFGRAILSLKGTRDRRCRIIRHLPNINHAKEDAVLSGIYLTSIMQNEVNIVKLTKRYSALLATCLLTLGMSSGVMAGGAKLFQTRACFSCHGPDAKSPISPEFPKIAGQNANYAFNQMRDIKSGARRNGQSAAMKGIMVTVSEEEMKEIAAWLRSLR